MRSGWLNALIRAALQHRVWVLLAAVGLLMAGIQAARDLPMDVFPEFSRPLIEVQTEAPGLSAEEVESLITAPLEGALQGVVGVETLRSKSVLGLSSVVLLLHSGGDLGAARSLVQERLAAEAPRLPQMAQTPVILPPLSSLSRAMKIGVSSATLSQLELSRLVRYTIRPRLMAVPGVANVAVWGQRDRQLQVLVDPGRLLQHRVTLQEVLRAASDAVQVSAGGFLDTPTQRLPLRYPGINVDPAALRQHLLRLDPGGTRPLRIMDVAEVTVGYGPPIGDAVIADGPGLLLIIEKQPGENTLAVTQRVEAALQELQPGLSGVQLDPGLFRPASFIESSLRNLHQALFLGCALVMGVLLLLLRDGRTAAISMTAIPLSLCGALLVLRAQGGSLNTMFLGGLVIAIGEVVDDAIIDVENIRRRLRQAPAGVPPLQVVLAASLEVRSAVVYASAIVCLVFLPVLFLGGLVGVFFRPLAIAYILSIGTSLLVALTVTPVLSLWLLPGSPGAHQEEPPLVRWLRQRYRALLPRLLGRPRGVMMALGAALLLMVASLPLLGEELLPEFQESHFLMHWVEKPGTSLAASQRITTRVARELLQVPGVRSFGAHIGRAQVADEVVGPNFTELWIALKPQANYHQTVARVKEVVAGYPGLFRDVLTYLKERIKEVLSGASASVVVRLYGPELGELRTQGERVREAMAQVKGVVDLKLEQQVLVPQLEVRVDPEAAARYGLSVGQVRRSAAALVRGQKVGEVYNVEEVVDVVVWAREEARGDLAALRRLLLDVPQGGAVPLSQVARLSVVPGPSEIKREGGSRRLDISCNVAGRDLASVAKEVEARVRSLGFPQGYHPVLLGEYAAARKSRQELLGYSLLALLGIAGVLYLDFREVRLVLLVMGTLPFALLGGVVGAFLGGGTLSLGSLVGFVSVLGIAARNGILLISHLSQLQQEAGGTLSEEVLLQGAEERLLPILMTALCAALGLLPIVAAGSVPGHEIEHPMAVVILGGLLSSTVLNLLLLPTLYGALRRPR